MDVETLSLAELSRRLASGSLSEMQLQRLGHDARAGARKLAKRGLARLAAQRAERDRLERMLSHERALWRRGVRAVAGVDEVGVGPMAGPVVAAAVVLPPGTSLTGIDDSKKLDVEQRERLAAQIRRCALGIGIGQCSVAEIDRLNIYHAARQAMRRAVLGLACAYEHVLVDARTIPELPSPQQAIPKGDAASQSVAAAAILAKVTRDAAMCALAERYPGYGFERHKGYCTPEHQAALARLGPCAEHRRAYAPVRAALASARRDSSARQAYG